MRSVGLVATRALAPGRERRVAVAALAALVGASTLSRFWLARAVPVPWIAPDEMIYGLLGRSLYESGELAVLGAETQFYTLVYPALIGLPLSLGDVERGYAAAKALQALVMSLAAVPVYLWARSLLARGWALVAAALTLSIPAFAYTGLLMTEVAFYPVATLAAWTMARALARPTWVSQTLAVAAIAAAALTRLQAAVFVPALFTAVAVKALLERRWPARREVAPALVGVALLGLAWSAWTALAGQGVLGAYGPASGGYELWDAARFVVYHLGDVVILTGFLPLAALMLLVIEALPRRDLEAPFAAYLAVAVSLLFWLVLEVGVFASRYVGQLAERDLIVLAPVLFIGLALWLERGAPRPYVRTSLVVIATLLPVLTVDVEMVLAPAALPDAFTLIPLHEQLTDASTAGKQLALQGGAALGAALFVLTPRRLLLLLPTLLAAFLGTSSIVSARYVADQAVAQRDRFLGPELRWIDRSAQGPVAYLYSGHREWNRVWENVFWNRRIERVLTLAGTRVPGPLPQTPVRLRRDGRLLAGEGEARAAYVVAPYSLSFIGTPVADAGQVGGAPVGLQLWRIEPPLRVSSRLQGVQPNGDIYERARVVGYACGRAQLRLTLLAKENETVEIVSGGRVLRRLRLAPPTIWRGVVPGSRTRDGRCAFEIRTTGLLGSTVILLERLGP